MWPKLYYTIGEAYNYMKENKNIKNNQIGFSLIEIMVSMAVFAILLLSVLSIAQSVSKGQKSAIASQNTQESLRFAFEVMSKEIRSAKESDDECNPSGVNNDNDEVFNIYNGGLIGNSDVLYFKNKNNKCVYYFLENDAGIVRLKIARDEDISDGTIDNDFFITPKSVDIKNLKFSVHDNKIENLFNMPIQPLVRIKIEAESTNANFKQNIIMETSVSSRHY